jgi:rare lipoprotein A
MAHHGLMKANSKIKTTAATLMASVFCCAAIGVAATPATAPSVNAANANAANANAANANAANVNSDNDAPPSQPRVQKPSADVKPNLDRTGKKRFGRASFYAKKFAGRKMADGNIMDPHDINAASKTLPLGTIAKVTNLKTGKSAVVTIEDRGPYVDGRIVDLSPATAEKIGLSQEQGVTKVTVDPIAVALGDGGVKFARDATLAGNLQKKHHTDWED